MTVDLGRAAYEAYGEARGWRTVAGAPMPDWADQSDELRMAWKLAAQAVANEVLGTGEDG